MAEVTPALSLDAARSFVQIETRAHYALTRDALASMVAGDYGRTERLIEQRLSLLSEPGDAAATAATLHALGELIRDAGDVARSLTLHRKAMQIYRAVGVREGIAWGYQNLGEVARCRGRYARAAILHAAALTRLRAASDLRGECRALLGLASVSRHSGDLVQARRQYRESLRCGVQFHDARLVATAVAGLGGVALDTGRPRAALVLLAAARRLAGRARPLPRPERDVYERDLRSASRRVGRASAVRATQRWSKRSREYIRAWLFAPPVGANGSLPNQLPHPWPVNWATGSGATHSESAKQHYSLALLRCLSEVSLDGIIVIGPNARILEMNRRFIEMWGLPPDVAQDRIRAGVTTAILEQVADRDAFLARSDYLHHHPDESVTAEFELKDGRVFDHYSAPIVDELGNRLGRVGYYRDVTERRRAAAQITAQREALRHQVAMLHASREQVTLAEERLRREIAELLHSRVQTKLVVVNHRLSQALQQLHTDPAGAESVLHQVQAELEEIRENEIRRASHLLHPTVISLGLLPALAFLQERFLGALAIEVSVDSQLAARVGDTGISIPEPLALAVYRVVEEALANVSRHAGVRAARVDVFHSVDGWLNAVVSDEGVGFDLTTTPEGLGLKAIASRVDQHGGSWSIESEPGVGTKLTARVPLTRRPRRGPTPRETHRR